MFGLFGNTKKDNQWAMWPLELKFYRQNCSEIIFQIMYPDTKAHLKEFTKCLVVKVFTNIKQFESAEIDIDSCFILIKPYQIIPFVVHTISNSAFEKYTIFDDNDSNSYCWAALCHSIPNKKMVSIQRKEELLSGPKIVEIDEIQYILRAEKRRKSLGTDENDCIFYKKQIIGDIRKTFKVYSNDERLKYFILINDDMKNPIFVWEIIKGQDVKEIRDDVDEDSILTFNKVLMANDRKELYIDNNTGTRVFGVKEQSNTRGLVKRIF